MTYCPLLKAYGNRKSLLVFHLRHFTTILQFPVWVLSGATWNCTPAKPHIAPSTHLLLFHLWLYFSLFFPSIFALLCLHSHFHPLALPACTMSWLVCYESVKLYVDISHSGNQSAVSLSVRRLISLVPHLTLLLNYSFNFWVDRSTT